MTGVATYCCPDVSLIKSRQQVRSCIVETISVGHVPIIGGYSPCRHRIGIHVLQRLKHSVRSQEIVVILHLCRVVREPKGKRSLDLKGNQFRHNTGNIPVEQCAMTLSPQRDMFSPSPATSKLPRGFRMQEIRDGKRSLGPRGTPRACPLLPPMRIS